MTPSTITIEGVEYDLIPKSENKKDWEIVSFQKGYGILVLSNGKYRNDTNSIGLNNCLSMGFPIISVRRTSDGEVFSVDDEIEDGKIKSIVIRPINPESTVEQCWIDCLNQCGTDLMYAEKVPPRKVEREPLFTTEDGVKKYKKDDCIIVDIDDDYSIEGWYSLPYPLRIDSRDISGFKYFHSTEKAKEYVILNKPFMSVQDVMNRLNGYFKDSTRSAALENLNHFAKEKLK